MGVGFHHWSRRNHHGATVLLEEGIARLEPFRPACQGIDVERLVADATAARERLLELGAERMAEEDLSRAPRIVLLGGVAYRKSRARLPVRDT